jgi:pilus assembly protein Flp/PilA
MLGSMCKRRQQASEEVEMKEFWTKLWRDSQGQDLVEYALAAGLVAVAAVAAMPHLSAVVSNVFVKIGSIIDAKVT